MNQNAWEHTAKVHNCVIAANSTRRRISNDCVSDFVVACEDIHGERLIPDKKQRELEKLADRLFVSTHFELMTLMAS